MEDLIIEGSDVNPTVIFKTNGELLLEGRALPENAHRFFQPLILWARNIDSREINVTFNLDYFNTSVSKQLLDLFKAFTDNQHAESVNMLWMYEDGDDEMLESGEIYEELLPRMKFTYKRYAETVE